MQQPKVNKTYYVAYMCTIPLHVHYIIVQSPGARNNVLKG